MTTTATKKIDAYELAGLLGDMARRPDVGDIRPEHRVWLVRFTDACRWRILGSFERADFVEYVQTQLGGRDCDRVSDFLEDLFCEVGLTADACWEDFECLLEF